MRMLRAAAIALTTLVIIGLTSHLQVHADAFTRIVKILESMIEAPAERILPEPEALHRQTDTGRSGDEAPSAFTRPDGNKATAESYIKYSESWDDDSVEQLKKSWDSEPEPLDKHGRKLLERICEASTIDTDEKVMAWIFLMGWGVPDSYQTILKGAREIEGFAAKIVNPDKAPLDLRCSLRRKRFKEKLSDFIEDMTKNEMPAACAGAIVDQLAPEETCQNSIEP